MAPKNKKAWTPMHRLVVGELLQLAVIFGWQIVTNDIDSFKKNILQMSIDEQLPHGPKYTLLDACVKEESYLYNILHDAVDSLLAVRRRWSKNCSFFRSLLHTIFTHVHAKLLLSLFPYDFQAMSPAHFLVMQ